MVISGNVCALFCFRGGKKALPTEPRVQAVQLVAVHFDMEMSYSSASNFEETEDISDEVEDFSSDTLEVLTLMETVRRVPVFTHGVDSTIMSTWFFLEL